MLFTTTHNMFYDLHLTPYRGLKWIFILWYIENTHSSQLINQRTVEFILLIVSFQISEPLWCDFHGFWIHSSTEVGQIYFWCITWHQIPLPLYILQILLASKYFAKKLRIIQPPSPDIFQNHYSIPSLKGDTLLIPSYKIEYPETNLPWLLQYTLAMKTRWYLCDPIRDFVGGI